MRKILIIEEMYIIARQHYLDKVKKYFGKDVIIILTGQRRVGKSCILRLLAQEININVSANLIYRQGEKGI